MLPPLLLLLLPNAHLLTAAPSSLKRPALVLLQAVAQMLQQGVVTWQLVG